MTHQNILILHLFAFKTFVRLKEEMKKIFIQRFANINLIRSPQISCHHVLAIGGLPADLYLHDELNTFQAIVANIELWVGLLSSSSFSSGLMKIQFSNKDQNLKLKSIILQFLGIVAI